LARNYSSTPGQTILIVAHNGINRCLILSAIGIPVSLYHSLQQSNCCVNVLNFTGNFGDPVQVESLNQTAHLGIALPHRVLLSKVPGWCLCVTEKPNGIGINVFKVCSDIPLNDNGKAQAEKAAEFLRETAIDHAVTSPLSRPKETAQIILQYHPNVTLDTQGVSDGNLSRTLGR
jgi:probable phosphoglycerate mutase